MSSSEQLRRRRRLRGSKVRKGEVLRNSLGRVIDVAYVEGAVADALSALAKRPRDNKS